MKATKLVMACCAISISVSCADSPTALPNSEPVLDVVAAGGDSGKCVADFQLTFLGFPTDGSPPNPADRNGDLWVCRLVTPSGHVVEIDNTAGKIGSCPGTFLGPAYYMITKEDDTLQRRDKNGNGQLCFKTLPSGETVYVDDDQDTVKG